MLSQLLNVILVNDDLVQSSFLFQIIGGSWFNVVGAGLRVLSSTTIIDEKYKYYILIGGQSLAAIAQPFFLFVPAKIAAVWFKQNQRATANMIASMCKLVVCHTLQVAVFCLL